MAGIFTISLDFELHWGGFEKWPLEVQGSKFKIENTTGFSSYFLNTRKAIPQMLAFFDDFQIHATWATVGMLMHSNRNSLQHFQPSLKPAYEERALSAYHYIHSVGIGSDEAEDPFHFGASLVGKILNTPHQELGSHTFAHFYCNEAGQTVEEFRADLRAAQQTAALHGVKLKSLVFPRNQFNDAYLQACLAEGFSSVRSNPIDWFWKIDSTQDESFWKRLNRGADAYVGLGSRNTYSLKSVAARAGYPVCLPASRLLRPYRPSEMFLNRMKIKRICDEMTGAAQRGEVYHLWWHPHNFGHYPNESLTGLKEILEHFAFCQSTYGMTSLNMGETTDLIYQRNG